MSDQSLTSSNGVFTSEPATEGRSPRRPSSSRLDKVTASQKLYSDPSWVTSQVEHQRTRLRKILNSDFATREEKSIARDQLAFWEQQMVVKFDIDIRVLQLDALVLKASRLRFALSSERNVVALKIVECEIDILRRALNLDSDDVMPMLRAVESLEHNRITKTRQIAGALLGEK